MAALGKVYETVTGWMCSATAFRFLSTSTGRPPEREVSRYVRRDVRLCSVGLGGYAVSGKHTTDVTTLTQAWTHPKILIAPQTRLLHLEGHVDRYVARPLGEDDLDCQVLDPHLRVGHGEGHRQRVAVPLLD